MTVEVTKDKFSYFGIVIRGNGKEITLTPNQGDYESREKTIKEIEEILK